MGSVEKIDQREGEDDMNGPLKNGREGLPTGYDLKDGPGKGEDTNYLESPAG
jgi:hypothetical protein